MVVGGCQRQRASVSAAVAALVSLCVSRQVGYSSSVGSTVKDIPNVRMCEYNYR